METTLTDCYRHAGAAAVATCVACAQPICAECSEEVAGHPMCRPCVAAAQARLNAPADAPAAPNLEPETTVAAPPAPWLDDPAADPSTERLAEAPPAAGQTTTLIAPGPGRRILRGMLWGPVYGQWWTLLRVAWSFFGQGGMGLLGIIFYAFFYGFFGGLAGLIIGAANARVGRGAAIGIGAGIVCCFIEVALTHSSAGLINVVFYFFTGRFIGAGIAWRVQQPLGRKSVQVS